MHRRKEVHARTVNPTDGPVAPQPARQSPTTAGGRLTPSRDRGHTRERMGGLAPCPSVLPYPVRRLTPPRPWGEPRPRNLLTQSGQSDQWERLHGGRSSRWGRLVSWPQPRGEPRLTDNTVGAARPRRHGPPGSTPTATANKVVRSPARAWHPSNGGDVYPERWITQRSLCWASQLFRYSYDTRYTNHQ